MDLAGHVALVTGAGSGIGRAAAIKLAEDGGDLVLLGRTRDELAEVAAEIDRLGRRHLIAMADVSSDAQMRHAFSSIAETFGRLDVVFANAGINGVWAPIDELAYAEWQETVAINLGGTFLTLHHSVPLMKEHGGSIIVTTSINGTRTFTTAGATAYSTTKAGQLALVQMAALELAQYRIRVNAICPGSITTEIDDNTERRDTAKARIRTEYPDGRIPLTGGVPGTTEEVAELVAFLASHRSRHITGTPIWIDGGQSLIV